MTERESFFDYISRYSPQFIPETAAKPAAETQPSIPDMSTLLGGRWAWGRRLEATRAGVFFRTHAWLPAKPSCLGYAYGATPANETGAGVAARSDPSVERLFDDQHAGLAEVSSQQWKWGRPASTGNSRGAPTTSVRERSTTAHSTLTPFPREALTSIVRSQRRSPRNSAACVASDLACSGIGQRCHFDLPWRRHIPPGRFHMRK